MGSLNLIELQILLFLNANVEVSFSSLLLFPGTKIMIEMIDVISSLQTLVLSPFEQSQS